MRNIKITIEYDGSRYQGWTRLGKDESNNTISAKIIDVLGKMTGEKNIVAAVQKSVYMLTHKWRILRLLLI